MKEANESQATAKPWRVLKAVVLFAALVLLPFGTWILGSGIVMVTPPVYSGGAVLRVDASSPDRPHAIREICEQLRSEEVVRLAADSLSDGSSNSSTDPMARYLLWSSLSVKADAGPNLVKIEARSTEPAKAREIVVAVAEAYEKTTRESTVEGSMPKPLVYVAPLEAEPVPASPETRIMLGIAGVASLCLLLCIPFLRAVEGSMPLRLGWAGLIPSDPEPAPAS
ncbi:hypothetical protein [Luteolibacter luteus]|uniref:Polysaccharide chain length determinant N-terminal domain-containing protein n=1 Tax=Luteolibacter luteus TaxID=2728835 RepID=A0A858RD08_9BACT|nr:hypothetical protein [Luteolibacter luteus]QJE94926.1 hypothetical protein HHL09_03750 [Luteolibacter luteus]